MERGLARAETELGRDNADLSRVLVEIGNTHVGSRSFAAAIAPLERALAQRKAMNADARAEIHFLLAEVRWQLGKDRAQALALARRAREGIIGIRSRAHDVEEIDKWLTKREKDLPQASR
jgi:hypothetical protein